MQRVNRVFTHIYMSRNVIQKNGSCRLFSTEKTTDNLEEMKSEIEKNVSGFAKYIEERETFVSPPEDKRTFAEILRNSKFVDLGNPAGKIVTGKIYHTVGNDLYIDFGWKFPCVCQKPLINAEGYIKDAIVRIKIKDLELSTKFLGAEKDLTLLEADCVLLGLVSTPYAIKTKQKSAVNELLNNNQL